VIDPARAFGSPLELFFYTFAFCDMATTVRGRWYRRTRLLTQSRSHVKLYHNKRHRLCDDWDDTKSASLAPSPVHVTLSTTQYSVLLGQLSLLHETWDLIISALTDRAFSFHQGSQSSLLTTKYQPPGTSRNAQPIGQCVCAPVPLASKILQPAFSCMYAARCTTQRMSQKQPVSGGKIFSEFEVAFGPAFFSAAVTLKPCSDEFLLLWRHQCPRVRPNLPES